MKLLSFSEIWRQRKSGKSLSCFKVELTRRGYDGGGLSWRVPQLVPLHSRFWTGIVPQGWTVPRLPCTRCWGIPVISCEPLSSYSVLGQRV